MYKKNRPERCTSRLAEQLTRTLGRILKPPSTYICSTKLLILFTRVVGRTKHTERPKLLYLKVPSLQNHERILAPVRPFYCIEQKQIARRKPPSCIAFGVRLVLPPLSVGGGGLRRLSVFISYKNMAAALIQRAKKHRTCFARSIWRCCFHLP